MARPRKDQQVDIRPSAIKQTMHLLNDRDAASITMKDVAFMVGCKAPALYAYFASRDALLREVHDEGFRLMLQNKIAVATRNADNALERLKAGGLAYLDFAFERPGLYGLMFSPPPLVGFATSPFEADPAGKCLDMLRAAIRACQAEGYLPGMEPTQMAFTLWSAVHGAALLVLQRRAPLQAEQDPRAAAIAMVENFMDFIRSSRS